MNKKDKKKKQKPKENQEPTHRMMNMNTGKEKTNGESFRTLRHR